ncbi:MAG: hypothetical protein V1811_00145 [Candidatus Micrarchaeota archaeon]
MTFGKPREKKFVATRFDKDVCEFIFKGVTHASEIRDKMMLDPSAFETRLQLLIDKGIVCRDSFNRDVVRLGVNGYNLFAPKPRKQRAKKSDAPVEPQITEPQITVIPFSQPVEVEAQKPGQLDLAELLKSGAPSKAQAEKTAGKPGANRANSSGLQGQQSNALRGIEITGGKASDLDDENLPSPKSSQELKDLLAIEEGKALVLEGKEACELCKAKFKLNVKNAVEAKFGHCFCGAAYHKDCYESLSDTGSFCVRCGRKVKLAFDKRAEDAVKGIKDVFE